MAGPRRVQRSRRKGYKTPPGTIYVGRPTVFGNPFHSEKFGHAKSVKLYQQWVDGRLGDLTLEKMGFDGAEIDSLHRWRMRLAAAIPRLRGHDLQCWCPVNSRWCHANILLRLANEPLPAIVAAAA